MESNEIPAERDIRKIQEAVREVKLLLLPNTLINTNQFQNLDKSCIKSADRSRRNGLFGALILASTPAVGSLFFRRRTEPEESAGTVTHKSQSEHNQAVTCFGSNSFFQLFEVSFHANLLNVIH